MSKQKKVTFWQKVIEDGESVLKPCVALVEGESEPLCSVCHEPREGHTRRVRKHAFGEGYTGRSLTVTYVNGETHIRHNVQLGKQANHFTMK